MPLHAINTDAAVYVPRAFPASLAAQAADVASLIPVYQYRLWGYEVALNGGILDIPQRLYFPREILQALQGKDDLAYAMLLCLGTRHHDGFIRQACVTQLLERNDDWVVPYIVQLLGEYVVEIAKVINDALPQAALAAYRRFIAGNPRYLGTTRRRIISYWSCYYRAAYPDLNTYPPYIALAYLERSE